MSHCTHWEDRGEVCCMCGRVFPHDEWPPGHGVPCTPENVETPCEWCEDGFVEDLDNEGGVIRCPECSPLTDDEFVAHYLKMASHRGRFDGDPPTPENVEERRCDGSHACPAERHIFGCFRSTLADDVEGHPNWLNVTPSRTENVDSP